MERGAADGDGAEEDAEDELGEAGAGIAPQVDPGPPTGVTTWACG